MCTLNMHKEVADKLIGLIHRKNSNASIGLGGSVSAGTYRVDSDIDILVCSKGVESAYLVSFFFQNLKISIFVYSVAAYCHCKWEYLYRDMPTSYILGVRPYYDKERYIYTLYTLVQDNIVRGNKNIEVLIKWTIKQVSEKIGALKVETDEIQRKRIYYMIRAYIGRILYLRFWGFRVMTKEEQRNPLLWMVQIDKDLCEKYRTVMLYDENCFLKIEDFFVYVCRYN